MAQSLRILALEDVATEVTRAAYELKRAGLTCMIERVETESGFRRGLSGKPDLILSDFSLPRFDGLLALRIAQTETPEIPFIFVSGTLGEERAIEALKCGATDYVLKSNLARLGPVVVRALQENHDRRAARRAEQRFRDLVQTSLDWIWELDIDGRYVFSSPGVEAMLGVSVEEVLGSHYSKYVHEDDRALIDGALRSLGVQKGSHVARFRHQDGSYRWLERIALTLIDEQGLTTGFRGSDRDITVRKLQAERIERLSRLHVMLSGVNTAVLRIKDRQSLLQEVCRIATTLGGYRNAGILLIESGTAIVRPTAIEGAHAFESFTLTARRGASGFANLTEQALSTRTPAICNDVANSSECMQLCEQCDLRADALRWGYRACAALPLIVDGTAIGTLNLHASEVGAFNEEEVGVLSQTAGSLSFALQYLEKEGAAEFLAYFDPMTGLARRGLFCERLVRTLSAEIPPAAFSVLVFDVERLGALNDRLGRHGGDRLLQLVAERLKCAIPDLTRLAYFGNGCFGIVVANMHGTGDATGVIQAPLTRLFDQRFVVDGQEVHVAVRAGVAQYPADSTTADGVVQSAELAVKSAKESGERYVPYVASMNADLQHRMTLEQQLRRALEEQQFILHYQPKVSIQTGAIVGAEALLRWNDPGRGLRSPAEFIPILESSGLIIEVGQWVISQAVTDTLAWRAAGLRSVPFAVNVSTRQLKRRDFVDSVLRATTPLGAAGCSLDIEITENALMEDLGASSDKLKRLQAAGIGIAIDDFGTGHSSLGRLGKLAVDYLKIDRSFIADLHTTPSNQSIVSTIIALGRSFALTVIAEGVETVEELAVLRRLKCHEFQGYLNAKPMPLAALQSLVMNSTAVLKDVSRHYQRSYSDAC